MTAGTGHSSGWSRGRLWTVAFLILLLQAGLIAWFNQPLPSPRKAAAAPGFRSVAEPFREWFLLSDPTLFALPHEQGFSGLAWLRAPPMELQRSDWTEPRRWLLLPTQALGLAFSQFAGTNVPQVTPVLRRPEPPLTMPTLAISSPFEGRSVLRLGGGLADRRLLTTNSLPDWPHTDLLTNSVVQIMVDAEGRPASPPTLLQQSGLKACDDYALEFARTARFEPLPAPGAAGTSSPAANLAWGLMLFEWHTIPPPPTNLPAARP